MTQKDIEYRTLRAQQAARLLGDDLVKNMVVGQKDRLFTLWANTNPDDSDKREKLYSEYRGLLRIINELRSYVNDGKLIEERLKDAS